MTYVSDKQAFPKTKHLAVLIFTSVWCEGYDKGDPRYSEPVIKYRVFKDETEMNDYVQGQETRKGSGEIYQLIEAVPLGVEVKATVVRKAQ